MRLHHVLIDITSALQYCQTSEASSNRVQQISRDLHAGIVSLLRGAKCENFTFHAFTSLLPSVPPCQTLQMSPGSLQNLQSEIATNLRLNASEPSSAPQGSDRDASSSGVVKVLQRLMRKLSSSRNMYSAKPPKHTVFLFSRGPGSENDIPLPTPGTLDTSAKKGVSQSSNALRETLEKMKVSNMYLVWIRLTPPHQLSGTTLPVAEKTNPLEAWAENNTHLELKYFADLLKPKQPARSPLAFSLQKRLGITPRPRESRKNDTKVCNNGRIVVERNDEQDGHLLLCMSNVRILPLQTTTQNAEQKTTFVLSHYLKKWESPSLEKTFANTKPRTLKPRTRDDRAAFTSFMSFLMRTETVVVATEFIVDHQEQNVERRLVIIVPYTLNIASVCHIPYHVNPPTSGGSSLPQDYHQWRNWHHGGRAKRMDTESFAVDKSPEAYEKLLPSSFFGNVWQECSDANDHENPFSAERGATRNRRAGRQVETEMERRTEMPLGPSTQKELRAGKVTPNVKESSMKKSDRDCKSSKVSTVPKAPKRIIRDRNLEVPVTVTKNGFRYKRVSADRPGLKHHIHSSNSNVLGLSSKPIEFAAAKQVIHSSSSSRKSRAIGNAAESSLVENPMHTEVHNRVLSNRRKEMQTKRTRKAEQCGEDNRGSGLRLSKTAGSAPRRNLVLKGYSASKEPSRRAISTFLRTATTDLELGSHFGNVEEHRASILSTIEHCGHERKSVLQSSVTPMKSREREKRPRSNAVSDGRLQERRREEEAHWKTVPENNQPRRADVQGRRRVGAEARQSPSTSRRQKPVVSKASHAAQEHCDLRYKGDGKKSVSVDKAILYGHREEKLSSDLRNKNGCGHTDARKPSNSESMGSLLTHATPEGQAAEPKGELKAIYEAEWNRSSPADEPLSHVVPSTDTVTKAIQQFDSVIGELSNPSTKRWEPIVSNAMTQLSLICERLIAISHSWPQVLSLAKWRLRDDDAIIASIQGEQRVLFSEEHAQQEAINGKLWKAVIDAFEQAVWLLTKLMDPNAKVSSNLNKKPELFRRATTILCCAQVTAELASSVFDSSQLFRSALDSFFNSTLVHFAQASNHGNLMYWTRVVFEQFEKDVPSLESAAKLQTMKQTRDNASSSSLSHHRQNDVVKDRKNAKPRSGVHRPDLSSKTSSRNLSNLVPERKRMVQYTEPLRNHPAFRRGRVFVGVQKKKRKPLHVQPSSRSACPSNALDKLIHMGSLQSSLDAIKVPEARDHDDCDEAVEATDDEADKALVLMTPKSNPRRAKETGIALDVQGSSRQQKPAALKNDTTDTANIVKLSPVKKRKLALRDEQRIQNRNPDGVVNEPKPKRPHLEEQRPTVSLLNRFCNTLFRRK